MPLPAEKESPEEHSFCFWDAGLSGRLPELDE